VEDNGGKRRIAIACQGGGSHTAFTAGALRKILREVRDEGRYEIVALSGTSGGAVCAFLAWYALLENNTQGAIEALRSFWEEDSTAYLKAGDPESVVDVLANDFLSASILLRRASEATLGLGFTPELNPYRYHDLFDYWRNRLKEAIEKNVRQIDPEATDINRAIERRVNASNWDPRLFVGAVNTLTGDFRVFKSHKQEGEDLIFNDDEEDRVGVEAVLASAAIPTIFEATRTGEAVYWDSSRPPDERAYVDEGVYWDGLYSQNPPVRDLTEADPHEIWVLQINPEEITEEPKRAAEIEDRRNELSGNTSLNQELFFVRKINELIKRVGEWEYDHDEIPRKVFRVPPARVEGHEKKIRNHKSTSCRVVYGLGCLLEAGPQSLTHRKADGARLKTGRAFLAGDSFADRLRGGVGGDPAGQREGLRRRDVFLLGRAYHRTRAAGRLFLWKTIPHRWLEGGGLKEDTSPDGVVPEAQLHPRTVEGLPRQRRRPGRKGGHLLGIGHLRPLRGRDKGSC
jgi:NTE family protein